MCGIAGFFETNLTSSEKKETIEKMLHAIIHRGSDHSGYTTIDNVYLGHNRLSIIDLSTDSNQPFVYKHLHLIFNGELYNYIEIREELISLGYTFETNSDTEVLIKSFDAFGEKCIEKFMGMWAIVIYNSETKSIFCSRDRFGIKPFYYIHNDTGFYFASEIKALKQIPGFDAVVNLNHIQRYLDLGIVVYKDETFYSQIKSLPAAHALTLNDNSLKINKYWNLNKQQESSSNFENAKTNFLSLFKRSVDQHLRSDVKLGACLSGGIDSSSLVSTISKFHNFPLDTYNVYYDGKNETDERFWVNDVVKTYSNITPHFITPTDNDIQKSLKKIIYHQDGPIPSSGIMSQYFLFENAKKDNIKVIIDGQGADEYLAGYFNFYPYFFSYLLKKFRFKSYLSEVGLYSKAQDLKFTKQIQLHFSSLKNCFISYQTSKKLELKTKKSILKNNKAIDFNFDYSNEKRSNSDEIFIQHLNLLILPNLLHYEDRNSMAFTIESRLPFLDHRLVEYAYSLPFDFKIKDGLTKYILRESLKSITPDSVLKRTDKKGFTTPGEVKWLRGPLKDLLSKENLIYLNEICDISEFNKLIDSFQLGNNKHSSLIWRITMLNEWLKSETESGLKLSFSK